MGGTPHLREFYVEGRARWCNGALLARLTVDVNFTADVEPFVSVVPRSGWHSAMDTYLEQELCMQYSVPLSSARGSPGTVARDAASYVLTYEDLKGLLWQAVYWDKYTPLKLVLRTNGTVTGLRVDYRSLSKRGFNNLTTNPHCKMTCDETKEQLIGLYGWLTPPMLPASQLALQRGVGPEHGLSHIPELLDIVHSYAYEITEPINKRRKLG